MGRPELPLQAVQIPPHRLPSPVRRIQSCGVECLPAPDLPESVRQVQVTQSYDLGRKEAGVPCPVGADGHGGHRDAFGHLNRGQQRIESVEGSCGQRYTDDRKNGMRSDCPGQMRRETSAGYQNPETPFRRRG